MMEPASEQPSNSSKIVSVFLAIIALSRAASYAYRPPASGTATDNTIFVILAPQIWVVILIAIAVLLLVGSIFKKVVPMYIGAVMGVLVYTTFGYNLLPPVLRDPERGWQGIGELLFVAGMHGLLVRTLGPSVRSKARKNEKGT